MAAPFTSQVLRFSIAAAHEHKNLSIKHYLGCRGEKCKYFYFLHHVYFNTDCKTKENLLCTSNLHYF
jgi:hypothetical protein